MKRELVATMIVVKNEEGKYFNGLRPVDNKYSWGELSEAKTFHKDDWYILQKEHCPFGAKIVKVKTSMSIDIEESDEDIPEIKGVCCLCGRKGIYIGENRQEKIHWCFVCGIIC